MSTVVEIEAAIKQLPPEKREQVRHFVQSLAPEPAQPKTGEPGSALRVAASLNLDGPTDWSEHFEEYLNASRTKNGGA